MKNIKYTSYIDDINTNFDILRSFNYQLNKLEKFLEIRLDDISIVVARDHNHMCKLLNKQRPSWGVTTNKSNELYLYNPKLWKKSSTGHDYKDLGTSMGHQLVHIFLNKNNINPPIWLEEGLATFVSFYKVSSKRDSEYQKLLKINGLPNLISINKTFDKTATPALTYLTAERFIQFLYEINKIRFLKLIKETKNKANFFALIKKIYGKDVSTLWREFSK